MRSLLKVSLVVALALGLTVVFAPQAKAFHDGGVAHCNGCHTMHNSNAADPNFVAYDNASTPLLKGAYASDVCLSCHGRSATASGYGVLSSLANITTPGENGVGQGGGDFVFIKEDNLNDGHAGSTSPIDGDRAGHNVIAPSKDLAQDGSLSTSPGGSYSSAQLGCTSCHNPHGGPQFRFLHYGSNPKGRPSVFAGVAKVEAIGVAVFGGTEANNKHTAYKNNVSEWCAACHAQMHTDDGTYLVHPVSQSLGSDEQANYNAYNGTDAYPDPPVAIATPYLAAVPIQWNNASNTTSYTGTVDGTAKVMCLTCHRAHASSGPSSGRWDFNVTEYVEEGVESGSYAIPNPYAATSGDAQRSLCNKCHMKDNGDHVIP